MQADTLVLIQNASQLNYLFIYNGLRRTSVNGAENEK
jgi:hypothetical protein